MNKLEIENGKYQIENNNGIVKVYRYGELWLDGVTKFELCLIQRIEELEQQNKRYREALEFVNEELEYVLHSNKSLPVKMFYIENSKRKITEVLEGEE